MLAIAAAHRIWVWALGVGGLAFHGLALSNGPIALVQPIIISGIVFAVPVRAAISRRLPGPAEFGAVALTAAGLAAFLVASDPSKGSATTGAWRLCSSWPPWPCSRRS
jgi:hypothetical protein